MTIKERIKEYLKRHPEGVDDDMLAKALKLSARQQANQRCRELEVEGLVVRRRVHGKIHNFWVGDENVDIPKDTPNIISKQSPHTLTTEKEKNWFWEGNIQAEVIKYLAKNNYLIRSVADTASRQTGKDIIAEKENKTLWVSVKGYPRETRRTHPSTQAGHWFKQAIFDIIEYRGEDENVDLGIAFPDFPRYRNLARKISWLKPVTKYTYYWVKENGEITVE